jgi:colanic acid biosynthesis protein WcaH
MTTLNLGEFAALVRSSVLVSIDLIILNSRDEVLLGQRNNAPAKGFWFVPGGRILKNETLKEAARRISEREIGFSIPEGSYELRGIYDHIYEDSFFDPKVSTHYVVIACTHHVKDGVKFTGDDQHSELRFFSVEQLLASQNVHENTKSYFRSQPDNLFLECQKATES